MSAPDLDHDDDDDCSNCGGTGYVDSCFEDTCVCLDPPCHWARCDWCNHDGKTHPHRPPTADDERKPKPAGPLLQIMEKDDA